MRKEETVRLKEFLKEVCTKVNQIEKEIDQKDDIICDLLWKIKCLNNKIELTKLREYCKGN